MSRVIQVLLTDAPSFPKHDGFNRGAEFDRWNREEWPKFRGKPILIEAKPRPPIGWTCDTDFLWVVAEESVLEIHPNTTVSRRVVCRHQIQIGD